MPGCPAPDGLTSAWPPELASARRRCVAWLRPGWVRGVSGLEADMAGDDRGLVGELDVAYSSAEEFGRLVLEWLTEAVRFLAGDVSDEILAGPPLKPYWHRGVIDEGDPRFALRVPPLWGDVSILYPPRNMHYAKPYSRTSLKRLAALAPVLREATVSLRRESAGCGGRVAPGGGQRVRPAAGVALPG